jgi:divalent metal cation (Fe/Co/Zn/Cd) transporter
LMVVAGEDIAAHDGLTFVLLALVLTIATGNPLFDVLGSLVIGILLILVATLLVREVKSMLIGESADLLVRADIEQFIAARPAIAEIYNLITLQWGKHIVVTVKVRMRETGDVARLIGDINACEAALRP